MEEALSKLACIRDKQNMLVKRVTSSSGGSSQTSWRLRKQVALAGGGGKQALLPASKLDLRDLKLDLSSVSSVQSQPLLSLRQGSSISDSLSSSASSDNGETACEDEDQRSLRSQRGNLTALGTGSYDRSFREYFRRQQGESEFGSYQPRSAQAVLRTLEKNDQLLQQLAASQQKLQEAEALLAKQKSINALEGKREEQHVLQAPLNPASSSEAEKGGGGELFNHERDEAPKPDSGFGSNLEDHSTAAAENEIKVDVLQTPSEDAEDNVALEVEGADNAALEVEGDKGKEDIGGEGAAREDEKAEQVGAGEEGGGGGVEEREQETRWRGRRNAEQVGAVCGEQESPSPSPPHQLHQKSKKFTAVFVPGVCLCACACAYACACACAGVLACVRACLSRTHEFAHLVADKHETDESEDQDFSFLLSLCLPFSLPPSLPLNRRVGASKLQARLPGT